MRRKALSERQQRVLATMRFLSSIAEETYPLEYTGQDEVERLLGLEAAGLLRVSFDPLVRERSGDIRIPRAVVLGVTQEGIATLMRTERETPGILSRPNERPVKRRIRKVVPASPL
ncbi:hypothetical protein [Variovorax paradoxus]|jgi:hypothetical protein|uniref:hypothetical protein n=1 Tax=Variovorax paradoxus TaxID=34073 RepID=UPI00155E482C